MIKLSIAKDKTTGKSHCPHCYEPRTKLLYLHSYIMRDHIAYAYQCTNCRRIIWGRENIKIVKGESDNEKTT
jgi:hypothetical protein